MRKGLLALLGVAAAIITVVALTTLSSDPGVGAGARTPSGEPDLQGLWAPKYQIPLQRPAADAKKEVLTDAEVAEREADRAKRVATEPKRGERIAPRGTLEDLTGAYDTVFETDPGENLRPIGRRTSLIVDPPDGRIPRLTPEVQKRMRDMREFQLAIMQSVEVCKTTQEIGCFGVKPGPVSPRRAEPPPHYLAAQIMGDRVINRADGPEDFGLSERCLSGQLPNIGGIQRIVQSRGAISFLYEGWQRVVPVTTSPHLPSDIRLWRGDSRGRWEGNTLVVDVTNFTPKTDYQGSRENLHLIERFTRIDANTLEYVVTMEDPTTWEKPWTVKVEMAMQDQQANAIYDEPRCHDGNYALKGMLQGARADDRAFAAGRGPDPATMCYLICGTGNPEYAAARMRGRGGAPIDGAPR